jgi:8-oxo-dGTP pyrophosphatase MutT (NUDIX family)
MASEKQRWQLVSDTNLGNYRVFDLHIQRMRSQRSGAEGDFVVLDCPNACNVIAVTEDQQLVLVRQYRFGLGRETLEFPAGMVEADEDPLLAAQRELLEETGFGEGEWSYLGETAFNAAFQNNKIYSFFAKDVRLVDVQKLDHDEDIDVILYPFADLPQLIEEGKLNHAVMLSALYWYKLRFES